MPRKLKVVDSAKEGMSVAALLSQTHKLAKTVEGQAWGSLGASTAFIIGRLLTKNGITLLGQTEISSIGYVVAVAAYTLLSRSSISMNRCLTRAQILFGSEAITQGEYKKLREACLKKAGLG